MGRARELGEWWYVWIERHDPRPARYVHRVIKKLKDGEERPIIDVEDQWIAQAIVDAGNARRRRPT